MSSYLFSIIIAFYNTEKYLKETIESVINQDIGFADNVQLILVDDGSSDNSKDIALEFSEKYPENIKVLTQENEGVSSARNLGLKHVEGKYINFLDGDDLLSENCLSKVNEFFKDHIEVNLVAIPLVLFGKENKDHYLNYKFEKTGVIDLTNDYDCILLSSSSSFIRTSSIINNFNTDLISFEDALFINEILIDKMQYGVVADATYKYRQRFDGTSATDDAFREKSVFTEKLYKAYLHLIDYSIKKHRKVVDFIQFLIVNDLNWTVKYRYFNDVFDKKEADEFFKALRKVLSYIDDDIILNHRNINPKVKPFLIYQKYDEFNILANPETNKVFFYTKKHILDKLHRHKINIDRFNLDDGTLDLSGFLSTHCNKDVLKLYAYVNDKEYPLENVENPERETRQFLGIDWNFYYSFELKVPYNIGDVVSFKLLYDEEEEVWIMPKLSYEYSFKRIGDHILIFNHNQFRITQYPSGIGKTALVSVIVPVYNLQEKIDDTFESIYNQSIGFENIDVILADNGSSDRSYDILNNYSKLFDNVKVLKTDENCAFVGEALNEAIENATTDYLMFLDMDETYNEDACEILYDSIKNTDLDLVCGNYIKVKHKDEAKYDWKNIGITEDTVEVKSIYDNENLLLAPQYLGCKIIKRDFVQNNSIEFPSSIPSYDMVFTYNCLLKAKGIRFIDRPITRHDETIPMTSRRTMKFMSGYVKAYFKSLDLFENDEKLISYPLNHLEFFTKQLCLSHLSKAEKINLLRFSQPLFERAENSKDFKFKEVFNDFIGPMCEKDYIKALYELDKLALNYREYSNDLIDYIKNNRKVFVLYKEKEYSKDIIPMFELLINRNYDLKLVNFDSRPKLNHSVNIYEHYSIKGELSEGEIKISQDNMELTFSDINEFYSYFATELCLEDDEKCFVICDASVTAEIDSSIAHIIEMAYENEGLTFKSKGFNDLKLKPNDYISLLEYYFKDIYLKEIKNNYRDAKRAEMYPEKVKMYQEKIKMLEQTNEELTNSNSWKITKPLRAINKFNK